MFKKYKFSFAFSLLIFMAAFVLFYYMDLKSLTVWTLNVWDTLAESGNIRTFYEYSARNLYGLEHAMVGSDILIYLPWAVWNLPIWLVQHFAGIAAVTNHWMLLYSKMFLVAVFGVVLYLARRIAGLLAYTKEDAQRVLFLSASSLFSVTSLCYVGQNDVLVIAPFLAGIYELLRGRRKYFVLWTAVSVAFKPFFLFSYLAIVLFLEKDLLKDVLYLIGGCSLYVLQKMLFIGAPFYGESLSYGPTSGAIGLMLQAKLDVPPAGASLFFLGMGVIWLMAYFTPVGKQEEGKGAFGSYLLYYATAPALIFFLFTRYESYRPFYLVPLLFLLMMTKPAYARTNLLLETVASGALMYYYMIEDVLFYHPAFLRGGSLNGKTISSAADFITARIPGAGLSVFTAVFLLAVLLLLVINHPSFRSGNEVLCKKEEPWLLPVRSVLYGLPVVLAVFLKLIA